MLKKNIHHYSAFLYSWARAPRMVGAVIPSSKALSRALANQIDLEREGIIIELGAGTGTVTGAIKSRMQADSKILVVERDAHLYSILRNKFPHIRVVHDDAQHLTKILQKHHIERVNSVVCCLPLLTLPTAIRDNILAQIVQVVGAGGRIIQFTYGVKSPIPKYLLEKYNLRAEACQIIIGNVPPARVWVYHIG
jgi:phosphatidylethanolamine/phosphatidyl-N-methylethanolamine N-methyltransferase